MNMTIYQQIRTAFPIGQAARRNGLAVSQGGMALCPFHHDTHSSLKLNEDCLVSDENLLKKEIYDGIKQYVTTGIPKKVSNSREILRMECCTDGPPL